MEVLRKCCIHSVAFDFVDASKKVCSPHEASHILVPASAHTSETLLPALDQAGYKEYSIATIAFFLKHKSMEHPQYLNLCMQNHISTVTFIDRKELLAQLSTEPSAESTRGGTAEEEEDSSKRIKLDPAVFQDKEAIKDLLKNERTLKNRNNILSLPGTKVMLSSLFVFGSCLPILTELRLDPQDGPRLLC